MVNIKSESPQVIQLLGEEWATVLDDELRKDYMINLYNFIELQRSKHIVYPPKEDVFNAYKLTPYSKVRVCIIGQDPYINEGEAHGLAFSTGNSRRTPSLKQIENAVRSQIYDESDEYIWDNNLTRWAKQGVFLLNKVLTVDAKMSNSHKGQGWEKFVLRTVMELDKKEDVIFLLWGAEARALKTVLKSKCLECEHPVAASYRGGIWNNNRCFAMVNDLLEGPISW